MILQIPVRIARNSLSPTLHRVAPYTPIIARLTTPHLRAYTTPTQSAPSDPTASIQPPPLTSSSSFLPPPPTPPSRKKISLRPYIWASVFLLGVTTGSAFCLVISPPPFPSIGSTEDKLLKKRIGALASSLPIVQRLDSETEWVNWDAYSSMPGTSEEGKVEELPLEAIHLLDGSEEEFENETGVWKRASNGEIHYAEKARMKGRLTTGPLAGAGGLGGYQRVFYNLRTGEVVSVVYIGGAAQGWPGVAHGGVLATLLDEGFARAAMFVGEREEGGGILKEVGKTIVGSRGAAVTANLELNYLKPVNTNMFAVVRCWPVEEAVGGNPRKRFVEGVIEDPEGNVRVKGKSLYILRKDGSGKGVAGGM